MVGEAARQDVSSQHSHDALDICTAQSIVAPFGDMRLGILHLVCIDLKPIVAFA